MFKCVQASKCGSRFWTESGWRRGAQPSGATSRPAETKGCVGQRRRGNSAECRPAARPMQGPPWAAALGGKHKARQVLRARGPPGAAGGDKNKEENVGGGRNGNQKAGNRKQIIAVGAAAHITRVGPQGRVQKAVSEGWQEASGAGEGRDAGPAQRIDTRWWLG